jgi:hypothetical protein
MQKDPKNTKQPFLHTNLHAVLHGLHPGSHNPCRPAQGSWARTTDCALGFKLLREKKKKKKKKCKNGEYKENTEQG